MSPPEPRAPAGPAPLVRLRNRFAEVRRRRPAVDHLVRMQQHYGAVNAAQQAGAITYFAFLSFFPVLALAVFVVGYLSVVYPDANATLRSAVDSVVPGIIGPRGDQVSLEEIRTYRGWAAVIGLAGVLYSGLGWVSALREALEVVFRMPPREQPGLVSGKLRDLRALVVLGSVLFVAVALSGLVAGFSGLVLGRLGLDVARSWVVEVGTVVVGLPANALLLYLMFRLLAAPRVPPRSLWSGALLGAFVFEVLKQVSQVLLAITRDQPAAQAFGIALILVVWINYTSRVVLYAASWACTSREARAAGRPVPTEPVQGPRTPSPRELQQTARHQPSGRAAFAAGAVAGIAVAVVARSRRTS